MNVSIVIVSYNNFKMLKQCIESICKYSQEFEYEIIVVDNNSTEGPIERILSQYKNVKLIKNNKNVGFAAANNQALKICNCSYVLFLNNDTFLHQNSIRDVLKFANDKNEDVIVGCKLLNIDGSHQISITDFDNILNLIGEKFFLYKLFKKSRMFNRYHLNYLETTEPIEVDAVKGAFLFCTSSKIKNLGGFDESYFFYNEEVDLCYRSKKSGGKVYYYPLTSVYHYGSATALNYSWFKFKNLSIAKIQFFLKHYSYLQVFCAILIHYLGILIRVPLYFVSAIVTLNINTLKKSIYYFRLLFVFPRNKIEHNPIRIN